MYVAVKEPRRRTQVRYFVELSDGQTLVPSCHARLFTDCCRRCAELRRAGQGKHELPHVPYLVVVDMCLFSLSDVPYIICYQKHREARES